MRFPLKVKGLIIVKLCWKFKIDWEDQVPDVIGIRFQEEFRIIPEIPRFYDVDLSKEFQLHIFCNASKEAFAAMAYVRDHTRGSLSVSIIAGKGKVARAKGMPILRLELDTSVDGAKFKEYAEQAFGQDLNFASSFLWTYSKIIMYWLTAYDSQLEKRAMINFIHEREPLWKMPVPDVKKYSTWTKLIMKIASFIRYFRFKIQKV
ncbi:uncharacterized protein LOC126880751 [Diabrotica virgifera virgifera]|uniref:Uncharacterized protein n=1 Tax=Diabrotica virgifera virgifera TaxID=50390 RepID=A0ABM5JS41_DIAVI|nr:uncharacterized protein LOC126880751 [Diabrotica virgifera virgifera]